MQTLALELTTTFFGDTIAFVTGLGRSITRFVTAPIERIARSCDVAGVLERRRARSRSARHSLLFGTLNDLT